MASLVALSATGFFFSSVLATVVTRSFSFSSGSGLVDQAPFGGGPAVDVLAHQGVIHGAAEGQQLARDLGRAAAGQDAPVDLRQAELRLLRREGQIAGE